MEQYQDILKYLEVSALSNLMSGAPELSVTLLKIRREFECGQPTALLKRTVLAILRDDLEQVRLLGSDGWESAEEFISRCIKQLEDELN